MENQKLTSALDLYMNRMFKIIILGIALIAVFAGLTFLVLKLTGFYEKTPLYWILLFLGTTIIYAIIAFGFIVRSQDKDKNLKPQFIKYGKIFIAFIELIQWNFITYIVPSRDFWGFALFFILVSCFFLDHKFVLTVAGIILTSTFISWIIRADVLMPVKDDQFVPNMALRTIVLFLGTFSLWSLTFLIEKKLISELENIADYDTLTLLYSRRTLDKELSECISRFNNEGKSFSIIMCDLDDFKRINDSYGHDCGDSVLKSTSRNIKFIIGSQGKVFRYGGEEILCVYYSNQESCVETAEHIRITQEKFENTYDNNKFYITLTLGVATYAKGMSSEDLIKKADSNLYYGKSHGKNKVVV